MNLSILTGSVDAPCACVLEWEGSFGRRSTTSSGVPNHASSCFIAPIGVHADRNTGGDRDHHDPHWIARAGGAKGPGSRAADSMRQQSQAIGLGVPQLSAN